MSADKNDFAKQAEETSPGIVSEFIAFLKHNKKWWLLPIVLMLLAIGVLITAAPAIAPFIYTLF